MNDEDAVITTMLTGDWLTGDSTGKIYLWDVLGFRFKKTADKGPFEDMKGWRVSLYPPPLLGS